jgi:acylpyruvate hydrolase
LVTLRKNGGTRAGRVEGDEIVELDFADVGAILTAGALEAARSASGKTVPLAQADLAPPVPNPPKIICIGQNYEAHLREQNAELPKFPTLFNKWGRTQVGPRDEITLPKDSDRIDWEVELAFYIGRPIRRASDEEALDAIAGYTILNDVSVRDWQVRTAQWLQGKAWEGSTPVGPALVTPDELNPLDVRVTTEVDGQLMQDSRTSDLVFKPAQIAAYASTFITLEPGDLIATGTPSGVGNFRQPPVFLQDGQVMRTAIEGLGELINRCVKER